MRALLGKLFGQRSIGMCFIFKFLRFARHVFFLLCVDSDVFWWLSLASRFLRNSLARALLKTTIKLHIIFLKFQLIRFTFFSFRIGNRNSEENDSYFFLLFCLGVSWFPLLFKYKLHLLYIGYHSSVLLPFCLVFHLFFVIVSYVVPLLFKLIIYSPSASFFHY